MKRYTDAEKAFIHKNVAAYSYQELADALTDNFHIPRTVASVKKYVRSNGLSTRKEKTASFTNEQKTFLYTYYKGHSRKELTDMINREFNAEFTLAQITAFVKNHNLTNGRDSRLVVGHRLNQKPIGSETVWNISGKQYVGIKVAEPSVWKYKHLHVWESHYGAVPDGHIIIFLDGNTLNCNIDNLICISKKINVVMNKKQLPRTSCEETRASIALAELLCKIRDLELGRNGNI